jgi:toxin ParE1/3/4
MRAKCSKRSSPIATPGVAEVHLSRLACADLAEIDAFGAEQFGEAAAEAYQDGLDRAFARLADFPLSGEARPQFGPGMRCLVFASHRIIYRIEDHVVQIVRVMHHSRDVPRHLKQ